MSGAPNNHRLRNRLRNLAYGNWSTRAKQALLLGPGGDVRDVFYPNQGDSLLAARARLMQAGELGAVVYLNAADRDSQLTWAEVWDERGHRTAHLLITKQETPSSWLELPLDQMDIWIHGWGRED